MPVILPGGVELSLWSNDDNRGSRPGAQTWSVSFGPFIMAGREMSGKGRVAVAMSGGVDSSVAAALLAAQGYQVIGLTMRLWDNPQAGDGGSGCCSPEDIYDARKVASQLGIPFYVLNFKPFFEREVVDYFVSSYLNGRTPNPCIICNQRLKFELLLQRAKELNARLATGHYAAIRYDRRARRYLLKKAKDLSKDQSYFLFTMSQEQMADCIFPLADYQKAGVRSLAAELGIKSADKPDSQEVCFLPDGRYADFISQHIDGAGNGPGLILDTSGEVLGRHRGIFAYTVGQRRGLGIASARPYYVVSLNPRLNQVIVGREEELYRPEFEAHAAHWVSGTPPDAGQEVTVKTRYRQPGASARIYPEEPGRVMVRFVSREKGVVPGQAAVFYQDDTVIGGGWIAP